MAVIAIEAKVPNLGAGARSRIASAMPRPARKMGIRPILAVISYPGHSASGV